MRTLLLAVALLLVEAGSAAAYEPYSIPAIRAYSPAERAAIRATPMLQRPDRPGHIYGNTVRRLSRMGR